MSTHTELSPTSETPTAGRLRANRLFAAVWDWMSSHESKAERAMRDKVVSSASGRVLEIGCGTGASFPYYSKDVQVVATEPDAYMLKRAQRHLEERAITNVELHRAAAEEIPFEDGSFDTVVSCWVFCHISDGTLQALSEIRRLLKPGGELHFLEHVRNDDSRVWSAVQALVNPVWRRMLGAGCNLNRRTQQAIIDAGFEIEWVERAPISAPPSLAVYGVARAPSSLAPVSPGS